MKSLFTGIDSSSHTAVSSAQVIYSFCLICLFILLSLLTYFFTNPSLGAFLHGFRIPFPFPFPDSGFHVLVLPVRCTYRIKITRLLRLLYNGKKTFTEPPFVYTEPCNCSTKASNRICTCPLKLVAQVKYLSVQKFVWTRLNGVLKSTVFLNVAYRYTVTRFYIFSFPLICLKR